MPKNEDFQKLAGMSDAAVEKATGRSWAGWVEVLDAADAASRPHREIARHVAETYQVSGWWAQTVTVGYERIRGLRETGQRRDGSYEVNKSRTVSVAAEVLFESFSDETSRRAWLGDVDPEIRKLTPTRSIRMTWPDGTAVEAYFTAKGESKSSVQVQHRKLASQEAVEEMRAYWTERLEALAAFTLES